MMEDSKWETWKALTYPSTRSCENCFHAEESPRLNLSYFPGTYMGNRQNGTEHICTLSAGLICDVHNKVYVSTKRDYISYTDQQKHLVKAKSLWEWNGE